MGRLPATSQGTGLPVFSLMRRSLKSVFSIELSSAPTSAVTIPLASSEPSEGIITEPTSAELVFDSSNWNVKQFVTVKGVDDNMSDGTVDYVLQIGLSTSADPKYNGKDPTDLDLKNEDDDTP